MHRIWIASFIVLISVGPVYAQAALPAGEADGQKFQGFNLQGYDAKGAKAWDVKGDTADVNGSEITISNVNANAYGEQKMNVIAETGTINQATGAMRLNKDVIVTSENGGQLTTDSLNWDKENDLVSTEDDVLITDEGLMVSGKGMDGKPGLKNAKIKQNVVARIDTERVNADPSEPDPDPAGKQARTVTITSDGPMTIDQSQLMASFEDNVIATQKDQMLKADRVEVYFTEGMKDIIRMVCTGNVVLIRGENESYAQKATYDAQTEKLVLSGRPKLIMLTEGEGAITAPGN